eukprot:Sdes_comp20423_c0_seq1m14489
MSSGGVPYLGSKISLISKLEIRYEGILYAIDTEKSTVALANVRSFGTEGRNMGGNQVPPSTEVYEYIVFRGSDIKDLHICEPPQSTPTPPSSTAAAEQSQDSSVPNHGYNSYLQPEVNPYYNQQQQQIYQQQQQLQQQLQQRQFQQQLQQQHQQQQQLQQQQQQTSKSQKKQQQGNSAADSKSEKNVQAQSQPTPSKASTLDDSPQAKPTRSKSPNKPRSAPKEPDASTAVAGSDLSTKTAKTTPSSASHPAANARRDNFGDPQQRAGNYRGRGFRGRGAYRGRGGSYRKDSPMTFTDDFDFESWNSKFNREELESEVHQKEKEEDVVGGGNVDEGGDDENQNDLFYDKTKSFFDTISCSATEKNDKSKNREFTSQQRKKNVETFGYVSYGRGRGGGYRGRGGNHHYHQHHQFHQSRYQRGHHSSHNNNASSAAAASAPVEVVEN